MSNDKNKDGFKLGNSGRDALDDAAQRVRIEREVQASKGAAPKKEVVEEEPDEDDWSHLNHLN